MMEIAIGLIGVALGAALGIGLGYLFGRGRVGAAEVEARAEVAGLQAQLAAQDAAFGDRLAKAVLDASRRVAADLAKRNEDDAQARLAAQEKTLSGVVGPVQTKLAELEQAVQTADRARVESHNTVIERLGSVTEVAQGLSANTAQLRTALEGGATRGKWGEFQLQRIVEVAGLTQHVTWQTQQQEVGGRGAQRPDLLVRIPEGRVLVVDAKAPALILDGDGGSEEANKDYAKRLRAHITALSKKEYIEGVTGAVGFVFLFLPSEAAYAGALQADPDVLAFAAENRVAVVAPSTLLSALTVVESVWRQFEANEHLEGAVEEARELHKRLVVFAGHLGDVGKHIGKTVEVYNKAIGSLKTQVYPAARRMEDANLSKAKAKLLVAEISPGDVREIPAPALPGPDGEPTVALDTPQEDTNG
jgi:DNA recombination protein RmuC